MDQIENKVELCQCETPATRQRILSIQENGNTSSCGKLISEHHYETIPDQRDHENGDGNNGDEIKAHEVRTAAMIHTQPSVTEGLDQDSIETPISINPTQNGAIEPPQRDDEIQDAIQGNRLA